MKPRVLLVNGFVYLPGEGGYKRTLYLFNLMKTLGYQVTLLTSDFNHYAKARRNVSQFRREYPDYSDVEIVHMPPYKNNVSLRRWRAGNVWANNAYRWLKDNYYRYDLVYAHMPDIPTILRIQGICKRKKLKLVIDIRDLWPEVFRVILKKEWIYQLLTYTIKKRADKCYAAADELIAVSEEYLRRGLSVNSKSKNPVAVYIGATFDRFFLGIEKYAPSIIKGDNEIWVTYAGTLGSTYDLYTLLDTAAEIQEQGYENIVFKILGQGPEGDNLKKYAQENKLDNVDFVGFLEYEKMAAYLSKSDMTVNSVKRRASQSIINKVADYFAAGVPCLNGSLCKEMQQLINDYQVGINFEPENVDSLKEAILSIINDPRRAEYLGNNAKRLAKERFDRSITYREILVRLDSLFCEKNY